jgi:flagellar M-ring protein FliF
MTDTGTPTPAGTGSAAVRDRLRSLGDSYSRAQKLGAAGAVAAVVVGVLLMTRLVGGATYTPLFTELGTTDAATIVEELKSSGVPYQLADGGRTVLVPEGQVHETRLAISSSALPSNSKVGYGVLDDQGLTTSEFGQRVGFQRAMEGELALTIESIGAVQDATVHLALPEDSAFSLQDRTASASVLVQTRGGAALEEDQVQAIVNLVASGVKGLDPGAVTVADQDGTVLAAPGHAVIGGGSGGSRQKQTTAFERSVAGSIEEMLAAVVGPGAARVTVAADLDFDQRNTSRESFEQPLNGTAPTQIPLEQSTKSETFSGSAPAPAGVLGPDTPPAPVGDGASTYSLEEGDVRYAVNRVVESTNTAPGAINRMSVAVVVDEAKVPARLTTDLQSLVTAGAGIDATRGDSVALTRMPFDTTAARARAEAAEVEAADAESRAAAQRTQTTALAGFLLVVLMIAFAMYRRAARQRRRQRALLAELQSGLAPRPGPAVAAAVIDGPANHALAAAATVDDQGPLGIPGAPVGALDDGPATQVVPAVPSLALAAPSEVDLTEEDRARLSRQASLTELVERNPDEVAHLMRSWLGERRGGRR